MLTRRQILLAAALTPLAWGDLERSAKPVKTWNIAHRGGARLNPENTLDAFEHALELGCDGFELDIHLSGDRELVVIHDDSLDRTAHQPGVIREMTLAAIQKADPSVPSLRQALRAARGHCKVLVEIKHPAQGARHQGIEVLLLEQLAQEKMLDQVVIISFDRTSLKLVREHNQTVETGLLLAKAEDMGTARAELGIQWIAPHFKLASREYIDQAHALGLRVNAWTVNEEADMRQLRENRCDCITSDRPDLLKEILG